MLHGFRMSYKGGIHMYDRNSVTSFHNVFLNRSMNGIRMYDRYLITGATGFLGRAVSQKLASCSIPVRALVLSNDPYAEQLPKGFNASPEMFSIKNRLRPFLTAREYTPA